MQDKEIGEELEQAFPKYKFEKSVGRGASGRVYLVRDRQTQQLLAVKKVATVSLRSAASACVNTSGRTR
jgi:serine/threonine protein kinase